MHTIRCTCGEEVIVAYTTLTTHPPEIHVNPCQKCRDKNFENGYRAAYGLGTKETPEDALNDTEIRDRLETVFSKHIKDVDEAVIETVLELYRILKNDSDS